MSAPRSPMRPPALAGYEHVRLLGSGGYSDVFLYEQQMPKRPVAIKVLVTEGFNAAAQRQFIDEANAMAAVSTHPYIVTIFHAGVSESGHPHFVMEFYPQPNFSVRSRTEKMSVEDVLRTGIQVASAVETAHRAGILHRDIKPANILSSDYGRPGLTDFGIATSAVDDTEATGMSIPWSPPEVVSGAAPGDETADVYSLGATLYTLLAGRSPFEVPGGSNRTLDLLERIERGDAPPTGRADAPASLERILRQSMSRLPANRPQSAADLARSLQAIEVEQGYSMTMLEVRDDRTDVRLRSDDDDVEGTRLKNPVVIQSQESTVVGRAVTGPTSPGTIPGMIPGTIPGVPDGDTVEGATVQRAPASPGLIAGIGSRPSYGGGLGAVLPPPVPGSAVPTPAAAPAPVGTAPPVPAERRNWLPIIAAAVIAVVVALVAIRVAIDATSEGTTTTTTEVPTSLVIEATPPKPTDVVLTPNADGSATVTFALDDLPDGATVTVYARNAEGKPATVTNAVVDLAASTASIPAPAPSCVWLESKLENGVISPPSNDC